jgi:uncharacterized caspase-like protein
MSQDLAGDSPKSNAQKEYRGQRTTSFSDGADAMRLALSAVVPVLAAILSFLNIDAAFAASGETRLALVIGQSSYRAVPALPNAGNDARRMAELLASAGFDVTSAPDLSQSDMRQAISDFAGKVASNAGAVALVFYAGHGIQVDGENYLVPVDVDPRREADIPLQGVRLNDLMNTLGALPTKMRIVMLDACRNNPFPALSRTAGRGLAIVDTKAGASGSFISYSTSPGSEAEDGAGEDSPYTAAVLQIAKEPNVPIEEAFKRVRVAVGQATDGRQIPWESSSLTSGFKFFGDDAGQPAAKPLPPAGAVATAEDWKRDLQGKDPRLAYTLVIRDDSVAAYEGFVAVFAQAPQTPRLRSLLERRREMTAWANAVALNTGAAFEAFLASYVDSDLAPTARRMAERVRNRTLPATALAALGPVCPAPTLPKLQPLKKADDPQPTRRVDKPVTKKPIKEVVDRPPPKDQGPPPGAVMEGIGIGIGIGVGMGGGMGGGGSRGGSGHHN